MKHLKELKSELKYLAAKIRTERAAFKEAQRTGAPLTSDLGTLCYKFRHKHIVYCLLRGRTREQIENKVRDDNKPNEEYIQELLDGYKNHVAIVTGTLPRQEPITDMKRLYVLVDETLPHKYANAQAGHAIAQFLLENPTPMLGKPVWANEVLVILKAPYSTLKQYAAWAKTQKHEDYKWVAFHEPDLDNRLTAVANVQKIDSRLVKNLPLL